MQLKLIGHRRAAVVVALLAAMASGTAACGKSGGDAASGGPTTVKIGGSTGGDLGIAWIAQQAGFFKEQGLNVKFVNFVGAGAPAITSAFLGNSFDFLNGAVASTMSAKAAGAPIQAVFNVNMGQQIEIAMHNSAAARLKVPKPDGTDAKALAQFTALKGSHIKLAVTSTTSPAWNAIAALAKTHGMTVGVNQSAADIDVITTGTTTAMNAGYLANKYDAMASNPPTTSKPDSNIINMGLIQPLATSSGLYLDVLQSFAKKNPATTQKVVNAMVKAWAYAKQNPDKAEQMTVSMQKANEITDPTKIHTLFTDAARGWKTPVLVPEAFDNALKIVNLAQPKPISLTYAKWADPTFVNKAIKDPSLTQGVTVPATVPTDAPSASPSS